MAFATAGSWVNEGTDIVNQDKRGCAASLYAFVATGTGRLIDDREPFQSTFRHEPTFKKLIRAWAKNGPLLIESISPYLSACMA